MSEYTPHYVTLAEFIAAVEANVDDYVDDILASIGATTELRQAYCRDTILMAAESKVDGYISAVRSTPVPATSQYFGIIQEWVKIIGRYHLEHLGAGSRVREKLQLSYEDVMATLKDVARGAFKITDDEGGGPGSEGVTLAITSDTPDFDSDNLGEYF